MPRRFLLCVLCSGLLSACVADQFGQTSPRTKREQAPVFALPSHSLEAWWSFFGDPVYDRLISAALQLNTDEQPLDLVSNLTESYTKFRYVQNQNAMLDGYMEKRRQAIETLGLSPKKDGKGSPLQEYQAQTVMLTKQQSSFLSQETQLKQEIASITKLLPEFIDEILKENRDLPDDGIIPLLASEANVLEHAPKVIDARKKYNIETKIFSKTALNDFFGIGDQVFTGGGQAWRVNIGQAKRYIHKNANSEFQGIIEDYLKELESALISYAHLQEQTEILRNSLDRKEQVYQDQKRKSLGFKSLLQLENDLYKERLAALRAEYATFQALVPIYLKVGVY